MSDKKTAGARLDTTVHLFVVTLACGHRIIFRTPAPKTGERIRCRECDWIPRVVVGSVGEYAARCLKGKCHFYYHGGADVEQTEQQGKIHMRNCSGHRTALMQGRKELRKIDNDLPVPGTARWHADHPEHSGMLKEFAQRGKSRP